MDKFDVCYDRCFSEEEIYYLKDLTSLIGSCSFEGKTVDLCRPTWLIQDMCVTVSMIR